jgi:hypothetical protein
MLLLLQTINYGYGASGSISLLKMQSVSEGSIKTEFPENC